MCASAVRALPESPPARREMQSRERAQVESAGPPRLPQLQSPHPVACASPGQLPGRDASDVLRPGGHPVAGRQIALALSESRSGLTFSFVPQPWSSSENLQIAQRRHEHAILAIDLPHTCSAAEVGAARVQCGVRSNRAHLALALAFVKEGIVSDKLGPVANLCAHGVTPLGIKMGIGLREPQTYTFRSAGFATLRSQKRRRLTPSIFRRMVGAKRLRSCRWKA